MSVPLDWAARFGRQPDDLFDGCTNIAIGTAMLSDYARLCTAGPARRSHRASRPRRPPRPTIPVRTCILRRLETEMNLQGIVDHVLPVVARVDAAAADPWTDSPAARSPLFPDNTDTVSGWPRMEQPPPLSLTYRPAAAGPTRTPLAALRRRHCADPAAFLPIARNCTATSNDEGRCCDGDCTNVEPWNRACSPSWCQTHRACPPAQPACPEAVATRITGRRSAWAQASWWLSWSSLWDAAFVSCPACV